MKKTKPQKTTSLLMLTLLCTLVSAYLPQTATAHPVELEWLSLWTEPEEVMYWSNVTAQYEAENPGVKITMTNVEADELFTLIQIRHAAGEDPDILSLHAMWLPSLTNWKANILALPPPEVVADIIANYSVPAREGSTYKGFVWGYPTEYNSHALIYNKAILDEMTGSPDPPTTWAELKTKALACTTRDDLDVINQTGFMPYINGPEELRFEFMNLLWSNNGEYLDLKVPEVLFNGVEGVQALELFYDLIDRYPGDPGSYDPEVLPDVYWSAWADETLAMVIGPTWFTYIRGAMGDRFYSNIGVAPIPTGPQAGAQSTSVTYNWLTGVTKRAEDLLKYDAAWDFLKWLNKPQSYDYISSVPPVGPIPKNDNVSIMGDFLIYDSVVPSRIWDQMYGKVNLEGVAGDLISDDFWFKAFMDIGADYGRSPDYFTKSVVVQEEVATMFEGVAIAGWDPQTTADDAANDANALLPMAGDINMNGEVDIYDAVHMVRDFLTTPATPDTWYVGRSDINDDMIVDGGDAGILVVNYGRKGDP